MEQKTNWQTPATVLFWTVLQLLSFLLMNSSIRTFTSFTHTSITPGISSILALIEIIILLAIIRLEIPKQNKAILEGVFIGYFAHFSAIFFYYFLNSSSSSTGSNVILIFFSLQPLLSLILVRLYLGIILPTVQIMALLMLTIGALGISFFSEHSTHLTQQDAILGMVMVVLFVCRNIAMKHIYLEHGHLQTRWDSRITPFVVISFLILGVIESFYSPTLKHGLFKAMIAISVHVAYTFFTLTNFLRKYTIVTVAIFSMLSQFLCHIDVWNILLPFRNIKFFLSVLLCVCSVIIYLMSTYKYTEQNEYTVQRNDQYIRLEFTVFMAIIIALFFYTLPPKFSPRDSKNFKSLVLLMF